MAEKLKVMTKPFHKICDYSAMYYSVFLERAQREYEDYVERIALKRLAANLSGTCLEIGAATDAWLTNMPPLALMCADRLRSQSAEIRHA